MYERAERVVYASELVDRVVERMMNADPIRWEGVTQRKFVKVRQNVKVGEQYLFQIAEQKANHYSDRIVSNARNLCRLGGEHAYGKRLTERCHVLRYFTDAEGDGYFILYLKLTPENLRPAKRGRRSKSGQLFRYLIDP